MGLYIWETILNETLTKMNANNEINFAVSCSAAVTVNLNCSLQGANPFWNVCVGGGGGGAPHD